MVYVFLADGFEEIEALTPIDVLRRAGVSVQTVGVTGAIVTGAHGIPVTADLALDAVCLEDAQMIILPGGMPGTRNLYETPQVCEAVRFCLAHSRYVAAICAAPSIILGGMGVLQGKRATCYPGMEDGMTDAVVQDAACVQDGTIITGRGAGAAFDFALTLCATLCGAQRANEIADAMCYVR